MVHPCMYTDFGEADRQFHTFTACACLSAAVIREPHSMLAQSSLLALEEGVKLFHDAGKLDEMVRQAYRRS